MCYGSVSEMNEYMKRNGENLGTRDSQLFVFVVSQLSLPLLKFRSNESLSLIDHGVLKPCHVL